MKKKRSSVQAPTKVNPIQTKGLFLSKPNQTYVNYVLL